MKKFKNKIKNVKGITLIALVITVIVLIILAGVTLNTLLGENGIIARIKTAKDENEKATATETMNLKITNVQISIYLEKQRMPTLKELADNFCEDGDFEKVIEKTEVGIVGNLPKISNDNPTAIIAKLHAYPYEFEIDRELKLASIDGVQVASEDSETIVALNARIQELEGQLTTLTEQINQTDAVAGDIADGKKAYTQDGLVEGTSNKIYTQEQYNSKSGYTLTDLGGNDSRDSRTFDAKVIPGWQNLTVDNFAMTNVSLTGVEGISYGFTDSNGIGNYKNLISYNNNTGIVTVAKDINYSSNNFSFLISYHLICIH